MEEGKKGSREPFWEPVQKSRKEMYHCHLESSEQRRDWRSSEWLKWAGRADRLDMKEREYQEWWFEKVGSPAISPKLEDYRGGTALRVKVKSSFPDVFLKFTIYRWDGRRDTS